MKEKFNSYQFCQTCGKPIAIGDDVVEVRYGRIFGTAHTPSHEGVKRFRRRDFFHNTCEVAISYSDKLVKS